MSQFSLRLSFRSDLHHSGCENISKMLINITVTCIVGENSGEFCTCCTSLRWHVGVHDIGKTFATPAHMLVGYKSFEQKITVLYVIFHNVIR